MYSSGVLLHVVSNALFNLLSLLSQDKTNQLALTLSASLLLPLLRR